MDIVQGNGYRCTNKQYEGNEDLCVAVELADTEGGRDRNKGQVIIRF